ncbi:MAG: hypothetical protein ACI9MR_004528 [Myxococcota bacterium]|jgi:hypothetical protein
MSNHHLASKLRRVAEAKERQSAHRLARERRYAQTERVRLVRLEAEHAAREEQTTTQQGMTGLELQLLFANRVRHTANVSAQRQRIDSQSTRVHAATDELKRRRRDSQVREAMSIEMRGRHSREMEDKAERERDDQFAARRTAN